MLFRLGQIKNSESPIYKDNAIDIADPSTMQDTCHMNFVIDLAHCRVSES